MITYGTAVLIDANRVYTIMPRPNNNSVLNIRFIVFNKPFRIPICLSESESRYRPDKNRKETTRLDQFIG